MYWPTVTAPTPSRCPYSLQFFGLQAWTAHKPRPRRLFWRPIQNHYYPKSDCSRGSLRRFESLGDICKFNGFGRACNSREWCFSVCFRRVRQLWGTVPQSPWIKAEANWKTPSPAVTGPAKTRSDTLILLRLVRIARRGFVRLTSWWKRNGMETWTEEPGPTEDPQKLKVWLPGPCRVNVWQHCVVVVWQTILCYIMWRSMTSMLQWHHFLTCFWTQDK